jgi:histidinol-phosphate phosphatase family protein
VRAVFLDRDGVINYNKEEYVRTPEEFVFLPGSPGAVARLCRAGCSVFVVSNQAGVGKGLITEEMLAAITERMCDGLAACGGVLQGVYYCPHRPDAGCDCRKPNPGLLRQAARDHGIDLTQAIMVGDAHRDIQAGAAVGARTVLVLSGKTSRAALAALAAPGSWLLAPGVKGPGQEPGARSQEPPSSLELPSFVAADLCAAVDWILEQET